MYHRAMAAHRMPWPREKPASAHMKSALKVPLLPVWLLTAGAERSAPTCPWLSCTDTWNYELEEAMVLGPLINDLDLKYLYCFIFQLQ